MSKYLLYIILCILIITQCRSINTNYKTGNRYGLKDSYKETVAKSQTKHRYSLRDSHKEQLDQSKSKNKYGLKSSTLEYNKSKSLKNRYGLLSSAREAELKKSTQNRYGLKSTIKDTRSNYKNRKQQNTNPYSISDKKSKELIKTIHPYGLKNNLSTNRSKILKNKYGLSTAPDEIERTKKNKNHYGLKTSGHDQRLKNINKHYFEHEMTNQEETELTAYVFNAPGKFIPPDDYLKIFTQYKKVKIRAFLFANAEYDQNSYDLKYTVNDIKLMEKFLKLVLYTPSERITSHVNLKLDQFNEKFNQFAKTIQKDELILIYYSGNGRTNGMPIFTDMKDITPKNFYKLLNTFNNDTLMIMDTSYLSMGDPSTKVQNVAEEEGIRPNITRVYSNLSHKAIKEGVYKTHQLYKHRLFNTFAMMDQMGLDEDSGYSIFTLLILSYFAEFAITGGDIEVTIEKVHSYIHTKISTFEESGLQIRRPKKIPIISSKFINENNNIILFKNLSDLQERLSERDRLLRAMYKKAVRLQNEGNYRSAVNLFLGVLNKRKGGDFKNTKARLAECYLALANDERNKNPKRAIKMYKQSLKYKPNSSTAMYNLARTYERQGDGKKAKDTYHKLTKTSNDKQIIEKTQKRLAKTVQNVKLRKQADNFISKGNKSFKNKKIYKAQKYYKKAQNKYNQGEDELGIAVAYNNLGVSYHSQKKYDQSIKYHKKSLKIKLKYGYNLGIGISYFNIGVNYYETGKYNKAIYYFKMAVKYHIKAGVKNSKLATCYLYLSGCYISLQNNNDAIKYQKIAVKLLKNINDSRFQSENKKLQKLIEK